MKSLVLIALLCCVTVPEQGEFKTAQLKEQRVKQAHQRLSVDIAEMLSKDGIDSTTPFDLHLRAYKREGILEVWTRADGKNEFTHLTSYPFAAHSGTIGPKRKQGDRQVPEGFYTIDRFNPWSAYHLSLGLDYPNASDRLLGHSSSPGGDIFIHGDQVTIGCIPITDALIEELYLLCVEAKDRGQSRIPVYIYPARMDEEGMAMLDELEVKETTRSLWADLENSYCAFEASRELSKVVFLENGRHRFSK